MLSALRPRAGSGPGPALVPVEQRPVQVEPRRHMGIVVRQRFEPAEIIDPDTPRARVPQKQHLRFEMGPGSDFGTFEAAIHEIIDVGKPLHMRL